MKRLLFFMIVFGVSAQTCFGQAATPTHPLPGVYRVDYKMLFLLHPLMADFDLTLGRHVRNDINLKDAKNLERLSKEMDSINVTSKMKIEEMQKQIDACYREIEKLEKDRRLAFENPQSSASSSVVMEIEKEIQRKNLKIEEFRKSQEEVNDSTFDPMYIPRAKSQERVSQALEQIDSVLAKISAEKGGALILDSDFVRFSSVQKNFHPTMEMGFHFQNIGLRQSLLEQDFNYDNSKTPEHYAKTPEMQKMYRDFMTNVTGFDSSLSATLAKYPGVGAALGTRGRLFLAGGENADLTNEALTQIYRLNKIKEEITARILQKLPVQ